MTIAVVRSADRAATASGGIADSLIGTRRLMRHILRRDRTRLLLWVIALVGVTALSARSIDVLYENEAQIRTYVDTVGDNPALIMFAGPGYGFDDPNLGVILVNETLLWIALGTALMNVFLVVRHTRTEEETERVDLVRSLVVGRHAPAAATLLVAALANLVVGVGCTVAVMAFGFEAAGSVALGAAIGLIGLAFGAASAAAAQVASTARSALGAAAGLVALAYVVRGIGDVAAPALSWTTPFGWGVGVRAFADERWWSLVGLAGFAVAFFLLAAQLSVHRDLGAGVLPQRGGPATASAGTRRPLGLAVRLQRVVFLGWTVGIVAAGLVYGSIADDIEEMVADNPELAEYLARVSGATLSESYLATSVQLMALVICGYAISATLRARTEEARGTAEQMLAAPLTRWWWAGSHLVVATVTSLFLVVAVGLALGVAHAASVDDWSQVGTLMLAAVSVTPTVLVLIGVTTMLFGWFPRMSIAAWGVLVFVAIVTLLGPVLRLPAWLTNLSPLDHTPSLPAEDWNTTPIATLLAVGVALITVGLVGFRRRDLATD